MASEETISHLAHRVGFDLYSIVKDLPTDDSRRLLVSHVLTLCHPILEAWNGKVPFGSLWKRRILECRLFLDALKIHLQQPLSSTFKHFRLLMKRDDLLEDDDYVYASNLLVGVQPSPSDCLIAGVVIHNIIMGGLHEDGNFTPVLPEALVGLRIAMENYGAVAQDISFGKRLYQEALVEMMKI